MSRHLSHIFVFASISLLAILLVNTAAESRIPPPLFNHPVKVDSSGRPQYNQWQIQEVNRQKRAKMRQDRQNDSRPYPSGGSKKNSEPYYQPLPVPADSVPSTQPMGYQP